MSYELSSMELHHNMMKNKQDYKMFLDNQLRLQDTVCR